MKATPLTEDVDEFVHSHRPVAIKPAYSWLINSRLSRSAVQRQIKFRTDHTGRPVRNVSNVRRDIRNWEASVVQAYGEVNSPACSSCAGVKRKSAQKPLASSVKPGHPGMKIGARSAPAGPFSDCVSMDPGLTINGRQPWARGECANCLWNGQGSRCSLRPDSGTFWSLILDHG